MPDSRISVRVVIALPEEAREVAISVAPGTTAREAVRQAVHSGLQLDDVGFDGDAGPIGIHGRSVTDAETVLEDDRVELYRPLEQDPMERRRRVAATKAPRKIKR